MPTDHDSYIFSLQVMINYLFLFTYPCNFACAEGNLLHQISAKNKQIPPFPAQGPQLPSMSSKYSPKFPELP